MTTLIQQAIDLAQGLDVAVFPVDRDKRPILKGWRSKASSDPEEISRMFSAPGAYGIGVPCGPDNDLICFDLDFGHTEDPDRIDKLRSWLSRWDSTIEDNAIVRQTRSGGLHVIMAWPQKVRPPRRIMPKFEVIIEGFYFVWSMDDGSYKPISSPKTVLSEPPAEMLEVVERDTLGSGSALMTPEEAHEAMWSNGDSGMRHDALLRMTHDWVQKHPGQNIEDLCEGFANWFRDIYGIQIAEDRLDKLLEWRVDRGEASGELGRAMAGAARRAPLSDDMLARAAEKLKERGLEVSKPVKHEPEPVFQPWQGSVFRDARPAEERPEVMPWLLPGFIRVKGNAAVVGMSSVGKTTVTAAMIAGMLSGRTAAVGLPEIDRPLNVAWLNAEEETGDMLKHVEVALAAYSMKQQGRLLVAGVEALDNHEDGLSLVVKRFNKEIRASELMINEALVDRLVEEMVAAQIDIMIADPITEFNDGNENDRSDAKKLSRAFSIIAQRAGVAVLYWAHTGKPPENKRPDWYVDDIFAQRGSSQNIGALKTMGTLTPVVPAALNASKAWDWYAKAKDSDAPSVRNLIRLKIVKIKQHKRLAKWAYDIVPSRMDPDIPVALYMPLEEAEHMVSEEARANEDLETARISTELVRNLGVGSHTSRSVGERMYPTGLWPAKDMKATRPSAAAFLRRWQTGVKVSVDGADYVVTSIVNEGSDRFRMDVTKT